MIAALVFGSDTSFVDTGATVALDVAGAAIDSVFEEAITVEIAAGLPTYVCTIVARAAGFSTEYSG